MYCKYVWIDGNFTLLEEENIAITNHSLHYASSVFEGLMAYEGKVFRLDEHINRLVDSANTMYLHIAFSFDGVRDAILKLLDLNCCDQGSYYIRPLIWPDNYGFSILRKVKLPAHIAVMVTKHTPCGIEKSTKLSLSSWVKAPNNSIPHSCKGSGNYMNSILSKQEAFELGCDDALLLDYLDNVAEGASANVFFITHSNELVTPKTQHCLSGITRKAVLEIAAELNINAAERDIHVSEISNFAGAFLTGTAIEITPIQSIFFPKENKSVTFEHSSIISTIHKEYKKLCTL